ncbi:MAG TPA: hypothetical protein VHV28_11020 [Solirubrobacteraceae bacterium]|nr:hypothetical protein [Solirubrobacteraceae bacterium]
MNRACRRLAESGLATLILTVPALGTLAAVASADPPAQTTLAVTLGGDGVGAVTSDTGGIDCPTVACAASFDPTASAALTATPTAGSAFTGFSGSTCPGPGLTCTVAMSADTTVAADFDLLPTVSSPADGTAYPQASVPAAAFACAPGDTACTATSDGTTSISSGDSLSDVPGAHTLTVTGTAADGATVAQGVSYTVSAPPPDVAEPAPAQITAPGVVIAAPVNNAAYPWTALPPADFTCLSGTGAALASCRADVGGQAIADHQALPDALGAHALTVTATDADGLSTTASATYTVTLSTVAPPPVSVQAPAQGARYRLGQAVAARYACAATTTGPALTSCVGTVPAGHAINTRTLGAHAFSVSAANTHHESTTETVTYKVVPTTNRFVVAGLRATATGAARLALKLPGPGAVRAVATAWNAARGASGRHLAYGTVAAGTRRGGPLLLVVQPTAAGRSLLGRRGAKPVIALTVTYKPPGARARVVRPKPLHVS